MKLRGAALLRGQVVKYSFNKVGLVVPCAHPQDVLSTRTRSARTSLPQWVQPEGTRCSLDS